MVKIEVEVDTLAQLDEAIALDVDAVLLDNMTPAELTAAVRRTPDHIVTEASGGIGLDTVAAVAASGGRPDLVRVDHPQRTRARRRPGLLVGGLTAGRRSRPVRRGVPR